jgi:hypothetical protein
MQQADKMRIYGLILLLPMALSGCSLGNLQSTVSKGSSQLSNIINVYIQGEIQDYRSQHESSLFSEKPVDLPPIKGDSNWWSEVAVNQFNPSTVEAARKSFEGHGINIQENNLFGTCAESTITMNMNYLNKIYGRESAKIEDVIWMAGEKNLIYSDGGLSTENEARLAEIYGYKIFGRDARVLENTGYALTFDDLVKFVRLGYPVDVSVRSNAAGLNPDPNADINHAILVIGIDDNANTVTYISSQSPSISKENSEIRPRKASFETFRNAWAVNGIAGLGFVMYR